MGLITDSDESCDCDGCNPQRAEVAERLLELTGEVTKLNVLLDELPEAEVRRLSGRIAYFLRTIQAMPVRLGAEEKDAAVDLSNSKPVGEA